jgi:Zn-dependent protease with chaperone function
MRASYFDGQTARAHPVELSIDGDMLVLTGEGVERRHTIGAVEITDALGSTARVLRFVDGATCEVGDAAGFTTLLARHGLAPSHVSRWEGSWKLALTAVVLVVITGFLGYRYGLPALARAAADNLPASALGSLSAQIQRVLDRTVFSPTEIPGPRMVTLLTMFDALKLPDGAKDRLQLSFRKAGGIGANAMALPSGVVFVTDELVELTNDDRVIIAVIAHEAGHVDKRHGLRQVIQSSVVGVLVTWYLGDVSALGAAAPAALLNAKYSRDLEREADAYAARVLKLNNMPVSLLADALVLIEKSHGRGRGGDGAASYLSTHPATAERLDWLRKQ